jgi:hypothetical protein
MLYSRTETEQDDIALRLLSGCQYKVLRALVNRADQHGICFPGVPYLSHATGYNRNYVQRALDALESHNLILYRRRDAWDDETRRQLPNVMQLNPDYIRLAPQFEVEARELWLALTEKCGIDSVLPWGGTITNDSNQAPEPTPVDQRQLTSTNNQRPLNKADGAAADYANQHTRGKKAKDKNPDGGAEQREARTNQRNAHDQKSSVPPERPQYANPDSINTNLPDAAHEGLASEIRQFGISMPLARGFVVTYGYSRTKMAFDQVKKMGEKAREPAAVFRSIVQVRLADDAALAHEKIFGNRKQSGG